MSFVDIGRTLACEHEADAGEETLGFELPALEGDVLAIFLTPDASELFDSLGWQIHMEVGSGVSPSSMPTPHGPIPALARSGEQWRL